MSQPGDLPVRAGQQEGARARLEGIARVLDSGWRIPGTTIRFGADAVLNLLPGVGLLASNGVSAYLIWEVRRLGVPFGTLLRMVGNVGLDALISAVPLAGWVAARASRRVAVGTPRTARPATAVPCPLHPEAGRRSGARPAAAGLALL
jgi:hypothetical protein